MMERDGERSREDRVKKRTTRKRRKKAKSQRPDDYLERGPIRIARFGKNVLFESNWDPADFARMQTEFAGRYDDIVREIDQAVAEISQLVARLPALKLLHRAWWELAVKHLGIQSEVEIGEDQALAMRMVDYVQSMIASVPPAADQDSELSDEDWGILKNTVERLFQKINFEFQVSSTLKRKLSGEDYDEETEDFRYRAQMYWANVRGQRYHSHQVQALKDLIAEQSDIIEEVIGITSEKLIEELEKIWRSLIFGVGEAVEDLERVRREALAALDADLAAGRVFDDPEEAISLVMAERGIAVRAGDAIGRFVGADLFDLQKITDLPKGALEALSWAQGQEQDFMASGAMRGWPLKIWPVFRRPFIKIDNRYYCFDIHSLFDHLYRILEKIIFASSENLKQKWIARRKGISENLPANYLKRLLPGAVDYGEVFYPLGPTKKDGRSELDRLVAYDDYLFVIEVKAGSFTYTSPSDDFEAHIASMKALLESPVKQAKRFLQYLRSEPEVPIFDKDRKEVTRLRHGEFRKIIICAISLDPFTEFAAQAQLLPKLGLTDLDLPVWTISVDDLRVFAEIFDNPLEFLHFVEQRVDAFNSDLLQLDDELDHLGLYLEHNNYSRHAKEMVGSRDTRFGVLGYREEVDKFFARKLAEPDAISPLSQVMPARMKEMISFLSGSTKRGRTQFASSILNLDGTTRSMVFDGIDTQLERVKLGHRPQALSSFGEIRLTTVLAAPPIFPADHDLAIKMARGVIASQNETDRLLMEPSYFDATKLIDVSWQVVTNIGLSMTEQRRLAGNGERLRAERVRKGGPSTGRNDPCPCGSGKKYKKCCLGK